jgi:hypothetical protein
MMKLVGQIAQRAKGTGYDQKTSALLEQGHKGFDNPVGSVVIGVDELSYLLGRRDMGGYAGSGIGDKNIHPSVPLPEGISQSSYTGLISYVEGMEVGRQSFRLELLYGSLASLPIPSGQIDYPLVSQGLA